MKRAAILMLVLAACGDDGGTNVPDAPAVDASLIDAMPRETIMISQPLVVGELVEGIMTGGPSDYAVITLHAPTPDMDWNIHGHANGSTQVIDEAFKQTDLTGYVFTPPMHAGWYLLIRNSGGSDLTVDVKVELFGDMTWEWQ